MVIKSDNLNNQKLKNGKNCRFRRRAVSHTDTNLPFAFASSLGGVFLVVFVIQVVEEVVGLEDSLLTRWRCSEEKDRSSASF